MKKRILFMILTAIFCLSLMPLGVSAAQSSGVSATGGVVTVDYDLDVPDGTFVMMVVLPKKVESNEDVTASLLPNANGLNQTALQSANVEYLAFIKADGGNILHQAIMKDSLSTGPCCVYINYYGSNGWIKLGEFKHVGVDDIEELLSGFNNGTASTYGTVISTDVNGKKILESSYASLSYYNSLADETSKALYHTILESLRPTNGSTVQDFDINTLVAAFNETIAWTKLQLESDTETVLKDYDETYWNLPLAANDEFYTLSSVESTSLLSALKAGGYTKATDLEAAFHDGLIMGLFHDAGDWETLQNLIAAAGKHAAEFSGVRSILSGANLVEGSYDTVTVLNAVLAKRNTCNTMSEVEELFRTSLPSGGGDDDDDDTITLGTTGTKGNGVGGGIVVKPKEEKPQEEKPVVTNPELPFVDVASGHWAAAYIEKLYKNGVINGVSETEFAPSTSVARQDFIKILIGALDVELSLSDSAFSDLSVGCYYEPYIMAAYENGFLSGQGDGSFGMGAKMKREDVAVVISRIISKYNLATTEAAKEFSDIDAAASYAKNAIILASKAGIFSGDEQGRFNPGSELSRGEACAILCRLADLVRGNQ